MTEVFTHQVRALLARLNDQPRIECVSRVAMPKSESFFSEFAKAGYPVIFEGALEGSLSRRDIISILNEKYGEFSMQVRLGSYRDPGVYSKSREYQTLSLREYLHILGHPLTDGTPYAANHPLPIEVCTDIGVNPPSFYSLNEYEQPALWLGPQGAITPLHKDSTDNFSCQLWGEKKWTLFPVRDLPYLYMTIPRPNDFPDFATSAVDVKKPNLSQFPDFKLAHPVTVTVRAGEILYLPTGWGHHVESLSESLMVNFWVSKTKRLPAILEANESSA